MIRYLFCLLTLSLLAGCGSPYAAHYHKYGTLHPELLEQQKQECLGYGFRAGSKELAECRKDLAQDWKNNLEANRRVVRPSFGIHYGVGPRW